MSTGNFGTVNATAINVTGILQAVQVITTEPMQVSNIIATGTLGVTGLATLSNATLANATVQGNLTVNGVLLQEGFSPVNLTNITDKIALPINMLYPMQEAVPNLFGSAGIYGRRQAYPTIKPLETTFSVQLRKTTDSTPTTFLTSNTAWSNPASLDAFGSPAPLVKINDDGTFTYINVATSSITSICSNILPTTNNAMNFLMYEKINSWPSPASNNGASYTITTGDMVDNVSQMVAGFAKRGFPMPGRQNVKGYNTNLVFYNDSLITGESPFPVYDSNIAAPNLGFDLTTFASNSSVTMYLAGGVPDKVSLALPSGTVDWSNNITLPGRVFPVTQSSIQYQSNIASNTNVVFYDAATSVMNFNITNWNGYMFEFPGDGYTSNIMSNTTPSFFRGSFGFYRKPVGVTTVPVLPRLGNLDINNASDNFYLDPVQSDVPNAEFMIQTSANVLITYRLSTNPSSNTINLPRFNTVSSVLYYTAMTIPRYLSTAVNCSIRLRGLEYPLVSDVNEFKGFLLTNGTRTGDNEYTPYLTEIAGISSGMGLTPAHLGTNWSKNLGNLNYKADEVRNITPVTVNQSSESIGTVTSHEFFHNMQWSVGVNADDRKQDIFDDEWMAQTATHLSGSMFKNPQTTAHMPEVCVNRLTKGQYFPYSSVGRNDTTVFANVFAGTNLMMVADLSTQNWNYNLSDITIQMITSYDPNGQLLKLFLYYAGLKTANLDKSDVFRLGYYSTTRSINPNSATSVFSNAIISSNLHYSDGSSITNPGRLHHESAIALILARNNDSIPNKYKCTAPKVWFKTSYANAYIRASNLFSLGSTFYNQDSWDLIQTNEDIKTGATTFLDTCMPWYPKDISSNVFAGKDSLGRTYTVPNGSVANYTQDCSFAAMANVSLTTFTSNVTRNMHSLQSVGYCFSNAISNVTVELTEPTRGGTYGAYNSNISVTMFKYVPDRCVTNVNSTTGAYMMVGPITLSNVGTTTTTFNLNALLVDGVDGATFSNVNSNVTAPMASFNNIFQYGIDDETVYTASPAGIANKARLGMTTGYYQPPTRLFITNEYIDTTFNFTDANILDKLSLQQVKPSAVKISVA
jgi:hypothetical protein